MILQVSQNSPKEKVLIKNSKNCDDNFFIQAAIVLLVHVSKRNGMDVDELVDKCHNKILEMKIKNL